jgi:cadherin 23
VTAGSKNSEIVYSIVDGNLQSNFSIDPSTGEIQVAHPLDFELVAPTPL